MEGHLQPSADTRPVNRFPSRNALCRGSSDLTALATPSGSEARCQNTVSSTCLASQIIEPRPIPMIIFIPARGFWDRL